MVVLCAYLSGVASGMAFLMMLALITMHNDKKGKYERRKKDVKHNEKSAGH